MHGPPIGKNGFIYGYSLVVANFTSLIYAYTDKEIEGQKNHFTLKAYDDCKATNFWNMESIKMKIQRAYVNT